MKAVQNFIAVKKFMLGMYASELSDVKYTEPRKEGDKHRISFRRDNYKMTATFEETGEIEILEVPGRHFNTRDCRIVNSIISREGTQAIIKKKHDYFRKNRYFGLPRF